VRGGTGDDRRITFEAAPGEHVTITGAEVVTGWVPEGGTVWRAEVPNTLFGELNPFDEPVAGDWLHPGPVVHRGAVYLDGRSLHEAQDRAAVAAPEQAVAAMEGKDPQLPPQSVLLEQWQQTIPLLSTPETAGKAPGTNVEANWRATVEVLSEAKLLEKAEDPAKYWDSAFTPASQP